MQKVRYIMKKIFIMQIIFVIVLTMILTIFSTTSEAYSQSQQVGINSFPSSYQSALQKLSALHSNWTFTAFNTGMTWNEFIQQETSAHLRNTVHNSSDVAWKCTCGSVASGYACASSEIISYYADPRNFLTESGIFQFLEMSYNESVHTQAGVESIIAGTFMDTTVTFNDNGTQRTMKYSEIIMEAARETRISPYSIAIKIIQEVGRQGSSSTSGTYPGYEGYYNFFNIGAYDSGNAIENGLNHAKNQGWSNQYISIKEGSKYLSDSYISVGQNTAYFYKFDVVDGANGTCWHQYMTNVQDPSTQAKNLYNTYAKNNILDKSLNFIIPVFTGMPNVCGLPGSIDANANTTYIVNGTGVSLRESPTTQSTKIATLTLGEFVTVLEYECGSADGYNWAKIRRSNETEGYVANCYIDACNGNQQACIARVENTYIITVPEITIADILNEFAITSYTIKKSDGTSVDVNSKATSTYLLKNIAENRTYTIVVLGDANGDGYVNSGDLLSLRKHMLGTGTITNGALKEAADCNNDGAVNSGDLLVVRKFLLGTGNITL